MFQNLNAEMARLGLTQAEMSRRLGKTEFWIQNRIQGKTKLGIIECHLIKDTFFPNMSLDYLFAPLPKDIQNSA